MPTASSTLALFPLRTVLVPGASLGLRVFEPRYLDLVRDCGHSGEGFGVCLIIDGEEAGAVSATAAFGTEARIEDFGTGDDGLLTLRVRGRRRFRVQRTRVRDNGLIVAEVDWRDPEPDDELHPEHAVLAQVLDHILQQVGGTHADAAPACLDDAAWVGWRLVELLPLADRQRQALLQEDDPHARLDQILALVS
ncbi:MAG: LON peptidase substrate-binding domain-containing protein [Luteimonas sp.]